MNHAFQTGAFDLFLQITQSLVRHNAICISMDLHFGRPSSRSRNFSFLLPLERHSLPRFSIGQYFWWTISVHLR